MKGKKEKRQFNYTLLHIAQLVSLLSFEEEGQTLSFTVVGDKQETLANFKLSKKKLKMWSEVNPMYFGGFVPGYT